VRRALRPLDSLSRELTTRQPDEVRPIALPDAPRELGPVLASLNGLVDRVHAALDRERLFAADAAHQLRTPLAAALLHLENAAATESSELRAVSLRRAHEGLGRLQRLVNQFLELARWETAEREPPREVINLEACVRSEVEDAALLAAEKDLEVAIVVLTSRIRIRGWESALRALVRNLVDNAFRYTPAHGRVEVRVSASQGALLLEVNDSGPGIPPAERGAVLMRFRRGHHADLHGSGLGLSIVCRIAHLHGAGVELGDSRFGSGLCVRVQFPAEISHCASQPTEASQSCSP
jgi:two-component system, OmpR family, sensor histidine kinase QseC